MNRIKNQRGFGVVEVIIVVIILALVGFGGWYIWQAQNKPGSEQAPTGQNDTEQLDVSKTQLKMAADQVAFNLPRGWLASGQHVSTDCLRTIESEITCVDQTTIYPSDVEKVGGVPRYSVTVAVYERAGATTAKSWWENAYKGDNGTTVVSGSIVEPSTAKVNSYDAYRFKLDRSSGDLSENIVLGGAYVVLVSAVLDEPAPATGGAAKDWTAYLPAINDFVGSVNIQ